MKTLKRIFGIFLLKREERIPALVALITFMALNALTILKYNGIFIALRKSYHNFFVKNFHISGFDPLTYAVVSNWEIGYNNYRHPLLAFFMGIPYGINKALMSLTGLNLVQWVVAVVLVLCAFYSFIFIYRIFRQVVGVSRVDANLLSAYYFSFAYVMLSVMVPDHFCLSMMLLLMTLYITGRLMQKDQPLTIWQTVLLFIFTAGVSLNNGLKTFLAALFVNKRHFFSPKFLLLAVVMPCALIWIFARWEYRVFVWPSEKAHHEKIARFYKAQDKKRTASFTRQAQTSGLKDSARITAYVDSMMYLQKAKDSANKERKRRASLTRQGKPLMQGEFMRWTDMTTPRLPSLVHNLFGEGIQLHQDYLLDDELSGHRPLLVNYRYAWNYIIEAIIVALFLCGTWCARRSRFFWLVASFASLDIVLHIVLGFGLNEVYIMSAHWIYLLPIATAYLFTQSNCRLRIILRGLLLFLTVYLWTWNGTLLVTYML